MAFGDLKGGTGFTGAAVSITNPFSATGSIAVNVGDLIFAVIGEQLTLTTTACGDNLGNVYTATNAGTDSGTSTGRAFYSRVSVAGTLTSVNFTATASTNNVSAVVAVFEGPFDASPLDANPANTQDITSSFACPATGTLSQASEVVVCWGVSTGGTLWAATAPNILGPQLADSGAVLTTRIGYQKVSVTTTVTPNFTAGSNPTDDVLGTSSFKQSIDTTTILRSPFYLRRPFHEPRYRNVSLSTPYSTIDQNLSPSLYPNVNTFYVPVVTLQEIPAVNFLDPRVASRRRVTRQRNSFSTSTPYSTIDQNLAPSLFVDDDTFYAPIVSSTYDAAPSLYTNTNTFYAPIVSLQEIPASNLVDSQINRRRVIRQRNSFSVSAFYPTIDFNLSPSLYVDDDTFYNPIVSTTYDLDPGLYTSINTFYTPVVSTTYDLTPSLYIDDDTFYAPVVSYDQDLAPSLYIDDDIFYVPSVSLLTDDTVLRAPFYLRRSFYKAKYYHNVSVSTPYSTIDQDLSPSLYIDIDTFYTPVVSLQELPLFTLDIPSLNRRVRRARQRFFSSSGTISETVNLDPSLYTNINVFYTPIVSSIYDLSPSLYVNTNVFYTPDVSFTDNLSPSVYTNVNIFYTPTITLYIEPLLYVDPDIFYSPEVGLEGSLFPELYINTNIFYTPLVTIDVIQPPRFVTGGRPIPFTDIINVTVKGVLLTCTITLIDGHARTVSFFPGDVQIDVIPRLQSFVRNIEVRFLVLGSVVVDDDIEKNLEDLLLVISELC